MARRKLNVVGSMDSSKVDDHVTADVRGIDYVSVACYSRNGAWNAALVVTIEVSINEGLDWYAAAYVDAASGVATAVGTLTANTLKRLIPVYEVTHLRARVSTIGGTTTIQVNIYGEGEWSPTDGDTSGAEAGTTAIGGVAGGGTSSQGAGGAPLS